MISSKMRLELGMIAVAEVMGHNRPTIKIPLGTLEALCRRNLVRKIDNDVYCELTPEGRGFLGEEYFKGVRAGLAEQAAKESAH